MNVTNDLVLITGANRGIGLGLVSGYLRKGCRVIASCRHPESAQNLKELAYQYPAALNIEQLDVKKITDFQSLARKYHQIPIDILINNAGIFPENHAGTGITAADPQQMLAAFETNALGALMAIQHFQDNLLKSSNPRIINMSSQMGALSAAKGSCYSYRMSKVALNMLTKCFAEENKKIITIALRPGWVKTKMGGINAILNVDVSVEMIMKVIENLKIVDSGQFFDNEKNLCNW